MEEQRLTFIRLTGGRSADNHLLAEYACSCGNTVIVRRSRVKMGYTRSCGCLARELKPGLTHGLKGSGTYSSWAAMKQRCLNIHNKDYPIWGQKGITVCDRWLRFENFLEDMGIRPEGTTLDRIDGTGNYEPTNCRWATRQTQQRNRRTAMKWYVHGVHFETALEAAIHFNVSTQTIRRWVFGSYDTRRNKFTAPKEQCHATPRI